MVLRSLAKSPTLRAFDKRLPPKPPSSKGLRSAYLLYEDRGAEDGHAMDDWLEAERGIRGEEA